MVFENIDTAPLAKFGNRGSVPPRRSREPSRYCTRFKGFESNLNLSFPYDLTITGSRRINARSPSPANTDGHWLTQAQERVCNRYRTTFSHILGDLHVHLVNANHAGCPACP